MAVDVLYSNQLVAGVRNYPMDRLGKLRLFTFDFTQAQAAASDIGTTIDLVRLPFGKKRVIPSLSRIWTSAFGAARTLSIGHRSYPNGIAGGRIAEDATALINGLDVSAALAGVPINLAVGVWHFDMSSSEEFNLFATLAGGTMPIGAYIKGYVAVIAN